MSHHQGAEAQKSVLIDYSAKGYHLNLDQVPLLSLFTALHLSQPHISLLSKSQEASLDSLHTFLYRSLEWCFHCSSRIVLPDHFCTSACGWDCEYFRRSRLRLRQRYQHHYTVYDCCRRECSSGIEGVVPLMTIAADRGELLSVDQTDSPTRTHLYLQSSPAFYIHQMSSEMLRICG